MSRLGIVLGLLLFAGSTSPASAQWSPHWRVLLADTETPVAPAKDAAPAPEGGELRGNQTEKKTIAQMIDEALEQEFPEEKEDKIGKNYNETAKSSDVRSCLRGSLRPDSRRSPCHSAYLEAWLGRLRLYPANPTPTDDPLPEASGHDPSDASHRQN